MSAKICFRNHVGLPGQPNPPTIDGFIEPEDFVEAGFGTTPSQVDTGWTGAARITYVADTAVGAVRPLTVFQGLKDNSQNFIYLSFVVRRDTQFNDNDCIVLVLRPSFPSPGDAKDGSERRIHIFPNSEGIGVVGSSPNNNPNNTEYYRWNSGTSSWQNMGAGSVSNVTIKCLSWDLGVNNKNWSVEVQLPTTIAGGGANWIDLTTSFGFYYNVIRLCTGTECSFNPTPFDGGSFQFTWPRANYMTGDGLITGVNSLEQAPIPLNWLGQAFLGNVAGCTGVEGVKFQDGANSIGVLSGGVITNQIEKFTPNSFVARVINTALTPAQNVQASFRIANWGIGAGDNNKWNLVPATSGTNPSTPTLIAAGGAPIDLTMQWKLSPAEQNLYAQPPTPAHPLDSHQCIWVLLDSVQAVDFVESSMRRNCNFVSLSEHEQAAEISGDGYPSPPDGAVDQEMVLIVSQMRRGRLVRKDESKNFNQRSSERLTTGKSFSAGTSFRDPSGILGYLSVLLRNVITGFTVVYDWIWVTDGYRKTEFELTVDGKRHRIYEPVGAFGYIAEHEGLVSGWDQSVTPGPNDVPRFGLAGPDAYLIRVPHGGKAQIFTRLKAEEFKIPWWLWPFLILLFLLLISLFI
jgi:hypothetical protein